MAAQPEEIEREIEHKRHEIDEDLNRLEGALHQRYERATDWHYVVRARPLIISGVVAGLGLGIGLLAGRFAR